MPCGCKSESNLPHFQFSSLLFQKKLLAPSFEWLSSGYQNHLGSDSVLTNGWFSYSFIFTHSYSYSLSSLFSLSTNRLCVPVFLSLSFLFWLSNKQIHLKKHWQFWSYDLGKIQLDLTQTLRGRVNTARFKYVDTYERGEKQRKKEWKKAGTTILDFITKS